MSSATVGYLRITAAALIWGSIALIVRHVAAPTDTVVLYRVAIACIALVTALLASGNTRSLRDALAGRVLPWRVIVVMGIVLAANWICYFLAIRTTSVASAVFAATSAPVFIALLGPPLLGERVTPMTGVATAVALAGVGLLTGVFGDVRAVQPLGVMFGLLSAFGYALLVVLTKREATLVDPMLLTALQTGVATIALAPVAAVGGGVAIALSDAPWLLLLGVAHTAGAMSLYFAGLKAVPAQTAGVIGFLEPMCAAILAAVFLNEPVTGWTAVGAALVVVSALLVRPAAVRAARVETV